MMRPTFARLTAVVLVLLGALLGPGSLLSPSDATAQVMTDYTASPPFISSVTVPNILVIMDNSGSMTNRACEATTCGKLPDGSTSTTAVFTATTKYSGFFDSLRCYDYDTDEKRFVPYATAKATLGESCGGTRFDGNLLNWATFRRYEAVKLAMTGGDCNVSRAADGTCPPSGDPSLITIKAQSQFDGPNAGFETTCNAAAPPTGCPAGLPATAMEERMPTSVTAGATNLWIHLGGGDFKPGDFCVDNDPTPPPTDDDSCPESDSDSYAETKYRVKVVVLEQPRGIIQQIGTAARFGLMMFKGNGDGGRVLGGIGARQAIDWAGTSVETFNDNTAAMLDAIDESYPATWTPLAESLYEAARYIAQVNTTFLPSQYVYPIAFSGGSSNGVNFQSSGTGGIGSSEVTALTGSENCPSGYITKACGRDPYFFGSNHTPAWASPSAVAECCKTYVILFTDGEPTQDTNLPAGLQDYAHAVHGIHCTGSDPSSPSAPINSTCNTHPATPPATLLGEHRTDYASNGRHYLDDIAYWAHTVDLRATTITGLSGVTGHDIPGKQNLTIYTFYAFGNISGREILMSAAKFGAFEDSNGDGIPQTSEYDLVNNVTGESGADGVPDAYFESSNVEDLQDRILATIQSILQQTASGTSASVLASSTTGEGTAYQAYFYPTSLDVSGPVKWTGYLHSMWVDAIGNIREDTDGDGKQIYQNDKIIVTRYDAGTGEVLIDRYDDANGDGKADSATCSPCGEPLNGLAPIWEAGKRLALKDPATRKILTWVDSDDDGVVDTGEQMAFTTANSATIGPYLRPGSAPFTADNIINFVRGSQISGMRNRHLTVDGATKVWKLGDIVNSTPVIVGAPKERYDVIYGDSTYTSYFTQYKNRRVVGYVGANDGMLHAINAGFYHRGDDPGTTTATEHGWFTRTATDNSSGPLLGDELWGFIPYHLLPQLLWLTRGDYGHTYYVDLKPKVTDVRIFTADADHPNGWGTILIGGFRLGGSCKDCPAGNGKEMKFKPGGSGNDRYFYSAYFVLDITNPEVDPKLLWVFTDEKMGFTTSYPGVVRVNPQADAKTSNTNAKWFTIFGTGPTAYNASVLLEGALLVVDLKLGPGTKSSNRYSNFTEIKSGQNKSFMGDLMSLDANLDYRADVLYAGSVIETSSTPKWEGKLYRLTTSASGAAPFGGSTTPVNWGNGNKMTWLLYDFGCSPSPSCSGPKKPGPMGAAPSVTMDDSLSVWVFTGTGRFWDGTDKGNTETQYFFGLKDHTINGACTQGSDKDCQVKNLVNVSAAVVCSTCAGGTNQVTDPNNTGVTSLTGTATTTLQGLVASKQGWYTTLPTSGERALYTPTLFGGIVFFPTFVPAVGGVCTGGTGNSYLYALFYLTGSAYKVSVVGTDTVGGNTNVKRSTLLGAGVASQVAIHIGAGGTDSGTGITSREKLCAQMSTGELICKQGNPPIDTWSRYLSWINLRL